MGTKMRMAMRMKIEKCSGNMTSFPIGAIVSIILERFVFQIGKDREEDDR